MRRPCSVASRKSSSRQCRRNTIILISSISTHTVEALRCNVFVLLLSSVLFAPFCLHHSPLHRSTFSTVWTSRREAHRRVWLLRTLIRMACPICCCEQRQRNGIRFSRETRRHISNAVDAHDRISHRAYSYCGSGF